LLAFLSATLNRTTPQPTLPRSVQVDTVPSKAQIAFIPLGDDGEPVVGKTIRPTGKTPIELSLLPGDYLVEVMYDGRFHEVLRRVPSSGQRFEFSQDHFRWTVADNGKAVLPAIKILDEQVQEGMVLVSNYAGDEHKIRSFYVDVAPVTVADYLKLMPRLPDNLRNLNVQSHEPISLTYHDAVQYAEKAGKRLPTMSEWRHAQSALPPRLPGDFAEWTSTSYRSPNEAEPEGYVETRQIACGGSRGTIDGSLMLSNASQSASQWIVLNRKEFNPKVGLRCIRDTDVRFIQPRPFGASAADSLNASR
jgi:hypothetical protein